MGQAVARALSTIVSLAYASTTLVSPSRPQPPSTGTKVRGAACMNMACCSSVSWIVVTEPAGPSKMRTTFATLGTPNDPSERPHQLQAEIMQFGENRQASYRAPLSEQVCAGELAPTEPVAVERDCCARLRPLRSVRQTGPAFSLQVGRARAQTALASGGAQAGQEA